ncbi:MAG: CPBP family intramembrane metalloprotease [Deltaproteobacteria bacterium]|nr:CPBP family intramembrane metalloprotease [Deltaproteobacteria bacterium]
MEKGKIKIKTLLLCLGVVIFVEVLFRAVPWPVVRHPMTLLGAVRLMEAGLVIITVLIREKGLHAIGLSLKGVFPGIKRGCIWSAGFGFLVLLGGVLAYLMGIHPLTLIGTPLPADSGRILLFFMVGGLIGPITEEIFFRGVLYGFFRRWGALPAILLSTLAFVLVHPVFPAIPITQVVGGLLFAVAYEVEKNLMAPITIHCLGNMAIFAVSLVG